MDDELCALFSAGLAAGAVAVQCFGDVCTLARVCLTMMSVKRARFLLAPRVVIFSKALRVACF